MSSVIETTAKLLGKRVDPAARGSISTLNDLTDPLLSDARSLARDSRPAAVAFLRFHVVQSELDSVHSFVDDVLLASEVSANEWGRRDVICYPAADLANLAARTESVLADLLAVSGEHWVRVVPSRDNWDWSGLAGAPGVLIHNASYWWTPSDDLSYADLDPATDAIETVADPHVAIGRWLASRVAWELRANNDARSCTTIDDVASLLGLPVDALSNTARTAIAALLAQGWYGEGREAVPGFDGPDSLYR